LNLSKEEQDKKRELLLNSKAKISPLISHQKTPNEEEKSIKLPVLSGPRKEPENSSNILPNELLKKAKLEEKKDTKTVIDKIKESIISAAKPDALKSLLSDKNSDQNTVDNNDFMTTFNR